MDSNSCGIGIEVIQTGDVDNPTRIWVIIRLETDKGVERLVDRSFPTSLTWTLDPAGKGYFTSHEDLVEALVDAMHRAVGHVLPKISVVYLPVLQKACRFCENQIRTTDDYKYMSSYVTGQFESMRCMRPA